MKRERTFDHLSSKIIRKISPALTDLFDYYGFSPNQITILNILLSTFGCLLFFFGLPLFAFLGIFIIIITHVFDHCDGELARELNHFDKRGIFLDQFYHQFTNHLLYFGLGFFVYLNGYPLVFIFIGFIASLFSVSMVHNVISLELVKFLLRKKDIKYKKGYIPTTPIRSFGNIDIISKFISNLKFMSFIWRDPYDKFIVFLFITYQLFSSHFVLHYLIFFYFLLFLGLQISSIFFNYYNDTITKYFKYLYK